MEETSYHTIFSHNEKIKGKYHSKTIAHVPHQLKKEARSIYDSFLSESSLHAVNIDDTAQMEESALKTPTPDMFDKAQAQVHARGGWDDKNHIPVL